MKMFKHFTWMVLFAAVSSVTVPAETTIDFSGIMPVAGTPQVLMLEGGNIQGALLTVCYRPNSATEITDDPVPFDADGSIEWTPRSPGIASLSVTDSEGRPLASKDVAIRFSEVPFAGIAVMILAGLLLFGGAAYSLAQALRAQT